MTTITTTETQIEAVEARVATLTPSTIALQTKAQTLTIVDQPTYLAADLLLVEVRQGKQTAEMKIEAELTAPLIEPARAVLDRLYEIRRGLLSRFVSPFENAERVVKSKMAAYKAEERKRIEEEAQARRVEANRLAEQARQAREAAAFATTPAAHQRSMEEATMLSEQAAAVRTAPVEQAVKGAGSKVATVRKPEVTDMTAFIAGVVAGDVPECLLAVDEEVMAAYWKQDRGLVSAWPGVTITETTKVSGR